MDYKKFIIEKPSLQSSRQKYGYTFLTLLFWFFWLYLWQPLISLVAWLFGFNIFYNHLLNIFKVSEFIQVISLYFLIIFLIGIVFLSWAKYNNFKYKGKKRRGLVHKVSLENIAKGYRISNKQVMHAKLSRKIILNFDRHGNIIEID